MRNAAVPLVLLLFGISGAYRLSSQNAPYSLRVDVPLVSVDFTVVDSAGLPITNLNRYDFEVLDNGKPATIRNFSPVQTPYNIVVLLDCSESTRDRMVMLISATARFVDQLRSQDRVAIAAFGTDVESVLDWNGDRKPISTVDDPVCHGTNFYKALDWAEKKFNGVTGRRGMVVLTDGRDSNVARKVVTVDGVKVRRIVPPEEDREFQKILKIAQESTTPIYFLAVDTDKNPGPDYGGPEPDLIQVRTRMEQLSRNTGGRIAFPKKAADVVSLFVDISHDLGTSYSIAFSPEKSTQSGDKTPHKIEIRVHGEEYRVHPSRDTYTPN